MSNNYKVTEEDLYHCWGHHSISHFLEVLNLETPAEEARENILSLIGSEHDPRVKKEES